MRWETSPKQPDSTNSINTIGALDATLAAADSKKLGASVARALSKPHFVESAATPLMHNYLCLRANGRLVTGSIAELGI